jgi:hypothetical protein
MTSKSEISVPNANTLATQMLAAKQDGAAKSIFSAAQLRLIDRWIATNDPTLGHAEAIRRLVEIGLKMKT